MVFGVGCLVGGVYGVCVGGRWWFFVLVLYDFVV